MNFSAEDTRRKPHTTSLLWLIGACCLAPLGIGCGNTSTTPMPDQAGIENLPGVWHTWRGPNSNGVVVDQNPPTEWSDTKNVIWKVKVPGRGHASPIVVGDQIVLATADNNAQTQSVVSFDFVTGEQNWIRQVNQGNFNPKIYPSNTHASSSVTSNGKLLFAVFNNNQSAQIAALDLNGNIVWEKKAATFLPKRYHLGFGASPIIYNDTVIVTSECERDGSVVALKCENGDEVWRVDRKDATSYSTPVVADVAGREQMILSGANQVVSYDPRDGSKQWSVKGPWSVTCGTAVWTEDMVFVSGGYPQGTTMGINADGSEQIAWQNRTMLYEQSLLAVDGYIYGLSDRGIAYCWQANDGTEMWKERLEGKVSASPVFAGGNIYISVESGKTFVFKANPERFDAVAENQLGDIAYATPTFVNNKIIARVAVRGSPIQEWLYCIGER